MASAGLCSRSAHDPGRHGGAERRGAPRGDARLSGRPHQSRNCSHPGGVSQHREAAPVAGAQGTRRLRQPNQDVALRHGPCWRRLPGCSSPQTRPPCLGRLAAKGRLDSGDQRGGRSCRHADGRRAGFIWGHEIDSTHDRSDARQCTWHWLAFVFSAAVKPRLRSDGKRAFG